jgi:hypothetical protein
MRSAKRDRSSVSLSLSKTEPIKTESAEIYSLVFVLSDSTRQVQLNSTFGFLSAINIYALRPQSICY